MCTTVKPIGVRSRSTLSRPPWDYRRRLTGVSPRSPPQVQTLSVSGSAVLGDRAAIGAATDRPRRRRRPRYRRRRRRRYRRRHCFPDGWHALWLHGEILAKNDVDSICCLAVSLWFLMDGICGSRHKTWTGRIKKFRASQAYCENMEVNYNHLTYGRKSC